MIPNFKAPVLFVLALSASFAVICQSAHAIEYTELEVYGHQSAAQNEVELENMTSFSDVEGGGLFRSSFEVNYGVTNNWELAAYTDFLGGATNGNNLSLKAVRIRSRYSFFEKNQLPVDLGIYGELEFPRGEESKMEGELRGIIEHDFDRLNVAFNPMIRRQLISDGEQRVTWSGALSTGYHIDRTWHPHVDLHGELGSGEGEEGGNQLMVIPAIDARLARKVAMTAMVGFGLTDATEKRLGALRLEYEF